MFNLVIMCHVHGSLSSFDSSLKSGSSVLDTSVEKHGHASQLPYYSTTELLLASL